MMKFIMPIILTGIAITFFFVVTNPLYNNISVLQTNLASYNQALSTSAQLKNERDQLTTVYNNINPDDLSRLQKLLPDDVNNILLILEIQGIAKNYGMQISNVSYDTTDTSTAATNATSGTAATQGANISSNSTVADYGTFNLGFSTSGTYDNFINFTKGLESNLRIVDISSINFSSNSISSSSGVSTSAPDIYKYDFKIKTYWFKS